MSSVSSPQLVTRSHELTAIVRAARASGRCVGLVPTMGALHEGHLSLVRAARSECDLVVVTIFVNPTQFAPHEDFQKYPRTLSADCASLADVGVDFVFAPPPEEIYPPGFSTYVEPPRVAELLEGQCRPGHFRGVATVVLKLFMLAPADVAFFGRKDYQQSLVVRRMVTDLNVPIRVVVCPTVREPDGLAMSSRNRYLSTDERRQALSISRGLRLAAEAFGRGERRVSELRQLVREELLGADVTDIEYVAIADAETLEPLERVAGRAVALVAARVGATRLIDNWPLE